MALKLGIVTYGLDRSLTGIARHSSETVAKIIENSDYSIALLTSSGAGELEQYPISKTRLFGAKLAPSLLSFGQLEIAYFSQKAKFDIIHDTSAMTPLAFVSKKIKRVVTIYDVIPLSYAGHSTQWDNLVYRYWLPYIVPQMDAVFTISETSRHDIAKFYKYPLAKIINIQGATSAIYQPQSQETIAQCRRKYALPERYILYVGELSSRKNLVRVLAAFEACKAAGIEQKLVLVGPKSGKHAEVLAAFKQSALMASEIVFAGYVDRLDLPAIYAGADLFVYPSLYEGFGLPVLEAMASGTPVITSNVSSLPEVAGTAALLINPLNLEEIKDAMLTVLADADLQASMKAQGLRQAEKFTWDKTAATIMQSYEQILG